MVEIQAYQYSDIISYLLKLAWQLPSGMSFDHVMATACVQTITLLFIYFGVWELVNGSRYKSRKVSRVKKTIKKVEDSKRIKYSLITNIYLFSSLIIFFYL